MYSSIRNSFVGLAGALALSSGEARAHTDAWPVFYFDTKLNNGISTNIFSASDSAYIDLMINALPPAGTATNSDWKVDLIQNLTWNASIHSSIIVKGATVMTNNGGFWYPYTSFTKSTPLTFQSNGNIGPPNIDISGTNSVCNDGIAIRYLVNFLAPLTNTFVDLSYVSGSAQSRSGDVHYINYDPDLGQNPAIWQDYQFELTPEPTTSALLLCGGAYLASRRRRREDYSDITDKLSFDKKGKFSGMRKEGGN